MSIDTLIDNYVEAVQQYNSEAPFTCPSFSDIEGAVLKVGWATVRLSGREKPIWKPDWQSLAAINSGTCRKETIGSRIRWQVWERDNFTCQHCGIRRDLSVDHILAESKGGGMDLTNLQTLCRRCNSAKGTR